MSVVKFQGNPIKLNGKVINAGEIAPVVKVTNKDLTDIQIGGKQGKTQIIVAVPSLDTGVCATSARKFNEAAAKLDKAEVIVVSMDLPFAMGRFCTTEGIANLKVASDFRNKDFASAYGVLIADGMLAGLTTRAVFVIDTNGKLAYKEISEEIADEPNYDAALAAAKAADSSSCDY